MAKKRVHKNPGAGKYGVPHSRALIPYVPPVRPRFTAGPTTKLPPGRVHTALNNVRFLRTGKNFSSYSSVPGFKRGLLVGSGLGMTSAAYGASALVGYQHGYKKAANATPAGRARYATMERVAYNRGVKKGKQVGGKIGGA